MRNLLKKYGYKSTPARMAILKIFSKNKAPLDAEIVSKKLKGLKIDTNEATVYRTLNAFQESGILRRVDLRKDSIYFELAGEHHHHIVCTNCNQVEDFENTKIEKAIEKIRGRAVGASSKFKIIKDHSLELFGLCRMCA